jgi:hypothetical protein
MLDVVTRYSKQWRFRVNPKKGKSEVMIFGKKPAARRQWWLAGVEIGETKSYKYLGVELKSGLSFKAYKERVLKKARRRMMQVWAIGMRKGELPVKDCCRVWKALVRPLLEYGAVIWGDVKWREAEQVQREMGKMILRCSSKMANEVVQGELGWWSLKGRRDMLRLKYWGKVVGMGDNRLVRQIYNDSRDRYEAGKSSKWCKYTHELMRQVGMEEKWKAGQLSQEEGKKWHFTVKEKIFTNEQTEWKHTITTKPKLRTYQQLKTKLTFEDYLASGDRKAREVMTRLRGGTNELRIETGRYPITTRDRALEVEERRCLICMSGAVEDEGHFMLDCNLYSDLRSNMIANKELSSELFEKERAEKEGRARLLDGLIGKGASTPPSLLYCKRAMSRRNNYVRTRLDQKT